MSSARLSKAQVGRYSRQVLVNDVGVDGQLRLLSSSVLIVGAGGLGCPVGVYLAGAGVGTIGIVDFDTVSVDNLHRQVAHSEDRVGQAKAESLAATMSSLNSSIRVVAHCEEMNRESALRLIQQYDVVADCTDNAATRYLLSDACVLAGRPLVSASALRWEGQLTVYNQHEDTPCYRCVFPVPPNASLVVNCSEGGVVGPVVGALGSMQALEVIKVITGAGETLAGKLLLFDGLSGRNRTIQLRKRNPACAGCGEGKSGQLIDYEVFCGAGVHDKAPSLSLLSAEERVSTEQYAEMRKEKKCVLVDTRPPHEFQIAYLEEAVNVPLDEMKKLSEEELRKRLGLVGEEGGEKEVVVVCHRGNDSQLGVRLLVDRLRGEGGEGEALRIRDIQGGLQRWAETVDTEFPQY